MTPIELKLPGDKSVTHRLLLLAAIEGGTFHFENLPLGDDILTTLAAMKSLGCRFNWKEEREIEMTSPGFTHWNTRAAIHCESSGTTRSLLLGILSAHPKARFTLDANDDLADRPVGHIIAALEPLGAQIFQKDLIEIEPPRLGAPLTPIHIQMASAQLKSALLLHCYCSSRSLKVHMPPSRDHTERLMKACGARIQFENDTLEFFPSSMTLPERIVIPGDTSLAAVWGVMSLLENQRPVRLPALLLNESRLGWARILQNMGAHIEWKVQETTNFGENIGTLYVTPGESLENTSLNEEPISAIIDEIPLLGVCGAFTPGVQTLRQAEALKTKECNRLQAMITNFDRLGVKTTSYTDGWDIEGKLRYPKENIVKFFSFHDHRIAMAWAIALMKLPAGSSIDDLECTEKSFPEFSPIFKSLTRSAVLEHETRADWS